MKNYELIISNGLLLEQYCLVACVDY